jgi:hypothetical protein
MRMSIGRLVVPAKTANGTGTVETRYKERIEIKVASTVTAGQFAKLGHRRNHRREHDRSVGQRHRRLGTELGVDQGCDHRERC